MDDPGFDSLWGHEILSSQKRPNRLRGPPAFPPFGAVGTGDCFPGEKSVAEVKNE
jgi:hypothetical protein